KVEEVGEQGMAVLGGDALRVELHAVYGKRLVLEAHDDAVGLGRDLEVGRKAAALHDEGVIARDLEFPGQALEDALAGVADSGKLAGHRNGRAHAPAAVDLADGLVPEADAEDRQ